MTRGMQDARGCCHGRDGARRQGSRVPVPPSRSPCTRTKPVRPLQQRLRAVALGPAASLMTSPARRTDSAGSPLSARESTQLTGAPRKSRDSMSRLRSCGRPYRIAHHKAARSCSATYRWVPTSSRNASHTMIRSSWRRRRSRSLQRMLSGLT